MKHLKFTKNKQLLAIVLSVLLVGGCVPAQYVYSDTLIVTKAVEVANDRRGKYKYTCDDGDGDVVIWSNKEWKRGDTIEIIKSN